MTVDRDTYWIEQPHQLRCLTSPVRMDMIDHLSGREPTSVRELAAELGRAQSSIYHHLKKLLAAGLVIECGARVINRKSERLYVTCARRMRVKKALSDKRNRAVMRGIVGALCREAERDFAQGLKHENAQSDGVVRNLGFFRLVNRPSKSSLKKINALLDEVAEILWQDPDPRADLIALTWTMTPLADHSDPP